ncbi:MAG: isopentenyl phosphate kinase family protein [Candidatus Aenigmarchaeota archaeon]|nr:isopentenyl phosphate kinase family protein [Candidatus Aenigmarchaeota archaeon]
MNSIKPLFLIKLGGSLITDKTKPYTARFETITRLAKEIHQAREEGEFGLIVGHGGGSFPHTSAKKYQTQDGVIDDESYKGMAVVQHEAGALNRIIVGELIKSGERAISFQPSTLCLTKGGEIVYWFMDPLKKILEFDMLPVPYGDVGIDLEKGCSIISTEELLCYLAKNLDAKKVIMCGNVDGVLSGDYKNPLSKVIPVITPGNFEDIKKHLGGSDGTDVTGGMLMKVEKSLNLTKFGFEVQIINGDVPGNLLKALKGEQIGTIIKSD